MLQGSGDTSKRAKALRHEMSLPEVLLWQAFKTRPGGLKVRKSHPAGPYVADFYCHEARLVIEVDGEAHERGDRPMRDAARDQWFADRELLTLRIPAEEILTNIDGAVRGIVATAEQRMS